MAERKTTVVVASAVLVSAVLVAGAVVWSGDRVATALQQEATVDVAAEVNRALAERGLSPEAIDATLEEAIFAFVKKSAMEGGRPQANGARRDAELAQVIDDFAPVDPALDHIRGNPDAPVSLVVYTDLECPYCQRFHPFTKQALNAFPNDVNVVYRHFPLSFHNPVAEEEAMLAECVAELAGNEAFWGYIDGVFRYTASNGRGIGDADMDRIFTEIGVDRAAAEKCAREEAQRLAERIERDKQSGIRAGVTGTPATAVVDNRKDEAVLIKGARPDAVRSTLLRLLEKQS